MVVEKSEDKHEKRTVILYGCKTWPLVETEEHELMIILRTERERPRKET